MMFTLSKRKGIYMINVFKLMNNRSIYNVLWTRNIDSAIFNVIIVVYGLYLNCYYKKSDIGFGPGLVVLVSYMVLMICIMVSLESVMKNADPLSVYNRKKYAVILGMEILQIVITYIFFMSENKSDVKTFLYIGFNLLVMYLVLNINKSLIFHS